MKQTQKFFIASVSQLLGAECIPEYRFNPERKWRADYCINPDTDKIIVEVEGGAFTQGRHTRGSGFIADMEKYNTMTMMGFRLIRVTPQQLLTKNTLDLINSMIHHAE